MYNGLLEQFSEVSKNSCRFIYTKIFLALKTTLLDSFSKLLEAGKKRVWRATNTEIADILFGYVLFYTLPHKILYFLLFAAPVPLLEEACIMVI